MRVWLFNHYAVPPNLYPLNRPHKFAEYLTKIGYEVTIFAASTVHNANINLITGKDLHRAEKRDGVNYVYIRARDYKGNGFRRILNMVDYARGLLKNYKFYEKPDIIIATSVHPLTWLSGYRIARKFGISFIAETADFWPETLIAMGKLKRTGILASILFRIEKYIYSKADRLIFTVPGGKDYLRDIGIDDAKARYINNGLDLEEHTFNENNFKYDDVDLDEDVFFKVLYTGSMGLANELIYLVDVAKEIQSRGNDRIKFILFGDGYKRKELEELKDREQLNNIIFKGKVDKKYIPNILSKGDLNIFTGMHLDLYRYGLSLNKMFDYFGSGKPTISNIECGYDLLEEYKCGLTVEGGNPLALAEGILKFFSMPDDTYKRYCGNALVAARDFDYKVLTDKLAKIISELI